MGVVAVNSQAIREEVAELLGAPADTLDGLRTVIAALEALTPTQRALVLAPFATAMDDGVRQMVTQTELRELAAGGVAIGVHGKTHVPMTPPRFSIWSRSPGFTSFGRTPS